MSFTYAPVPYFTLTYLQNRLSSGGVTLRIDDLPPDVLGDTINEASIVVDEHLASRYDPLQMQLSGQVTYKAVDVGCYLLCTRRGNPSPGSVAMRYDRAIAFLERVRDGKANLWDCPERKTAVPTMSTMRVLLRPYPRSVVETGVYRSTGTVKEYARNSDPWDQVNGTGGQELLWTL